MERIDQVSAVILAAGLSRRMGQNKLLMDFHGKPMLCYVLNLVDKLPFYEKIIVTTDETAKRAPIPGGFMTVINKNAEEGQSASVRLGTLAASGRYYMFFTADMPFLNRPVVECVISALEDGKIIVPRLNGAPKNPVIFPQTMRGELLGLRGDMGGRTIIKQNAGIVKNVVITDEKALMDVDTAEEYLLARQQEKWYDVNDQ